VPRCLASPLERWQPPCFLWAVFHVLFFFAFPVLPLSPFVFSALSHDSSQTHQPRRQSLNPFSLACILSLSFCVHDLVRATKRTLMRSPHPLCHYVLPCQGNHTHTYSLTPFLVSFITQGLVRATKRTLIRSPYPLCCRALTLQVRPVQGCQGSHTQHGRHVICHHAVDGSQRGRIVGTSHDVRDLT
jgi:hypothetical protein